MPNPPPKAVSLAAPLQIRQDLVHELKAILPSEVQPLTLDEEAKISEVLKKDTGLTATAAFEGNKLNDSYGRMGAEQHLARFPGDSVDNMAPGLGGWGYVPSDIEQYYVAVQTLYLPNWLTETKKLADWYKFRKMVVVNPANGKVIITAVADAGPSKMDGETLWWLTRSFGVFKN